MNEVSAQTDLVLPISLYELGGQLHVMLRDYKDSRWPAVRRRHARDLAAVLARFLAGHLACLTARLAGSVDLVTTVPSTRSREEVHPLVAVVRMVSALRRVHKEVLVPDQSSVDRSASDNAFAVDGAVDGQHVLVVDDTFTTGARAQSAASALKIAGAAAVGVLVLGRVVRPEYNDACRALWEDANSELFRFDRCAWFQHDG